MVQRRATASLRRVRMSTYVARVARRFVTLRVAATLYASERRKEYDESQRRLRLFTPELARQPLGRLAMHGACSGGHLELATSFSS